MRIAVVANGEWDKEWGKRMLSSYDRLIAADGGGNSILQSGFVPDVLIGDLDSITQSALDICRCEGTQILSYPNEKDETDLELALDYAVKMLEQEQKEKPELQCQGPKEFSLLGATGGRIDHLLGNLSLMQSFLKKGYRIHMKDPDQELWLLAGDQDVVGTKGQRISIIPVTEKPVVRTEGLYYPLHGEVLPQDSPRGISNVFCGEAARIEVSQGMVLVVILRSDNNR